MIDFKLDSINKSIHLNLMLKGEVEPLQVEILDYDIIKENDKGYLLFKSVQTSREWVNVLVEHMLNDDNKKKIEIPEKYIKLLGIVL